MNCLIQVLDRFGPMAVKIMLRAFKVMLGGPHRFERFVDVRMFGRRRCRGGRNRRRCGNRRRRGFRSRRSRREGQRKEYCYQDEQS